MIGSAGALASPTKGFHEGPYILLNGGFFYYTADNNVRTGTKTNNDFEPTVGFNFGWNLKDYFAPELQARYSTSSNGNAREHVVDVNFNAVLTLVIDQLTSSKKIKLLPFLQAGPMLQFASLPADPASSNKTISVWAPGFSVGGGLRVLFLRYGYAGILGMCDFVSMPEKQQNFGGTDQVVIKGEWNAQPAFMGLLGVHF
jgi:hypothetical protein